MCVIFIVVLDEPSSRAGAGAGGGARRDAYSLGLSLRAEAMRFWCQVWKTRNRNFTSRHALFLRILADGVRFWPRSRRPSSGCGARGALAMGGIHTTEGNAPGDGRVRA